MWQTPWRALSPAGEDSWGCGELTCLSSAFNCLMAVQGSWILRPLCTACGRPWGLAPSWRQPRNPEWGPWS